MLYTKRWLDENEFTLSDWQRRAYSALSSAIADDANTFPCVPGRYGFLQNHMRFAFLGHPRSTSTRVHLASVLSTYGAHSPEYGRYTSCVVFFRTPTNVQTYTDMQFEHLFWSVLSDLHQLDTQPWPADIAVDPEHSSWEFCFERQPYFAFCTTPSHERRRSRHSECFTIAFQPRWVFKDLSDNTPYGRKLKQIIRQRLAAYDDIPVHPALGWYGQPDNYEWQQYYLRDDNSTPSRCPFLHDLPERNPLLSDEQREE